MQYDSFQHVRTSPVQKKTLSVNSMASTSRVMEEFTQKDKNVFSKMENNKVMTNENNVSASEAQLRVNTLIKEKNEMKQKYDREVGDLKKMLEEQKTILQQLLQDQNHGIGIGKKFNKIPITSDNNVIHTPTPRVVRTPSLPSIKKIFPHNNTIQESVTATPINNSGKRSVTSQTTNFDSNQRSEPSFIQETHDDELFQFSHKEPNKEPDILPTQETQGTKIIEILNNISIRLGKVESVQEELGNKIREISSQSLQTNSEESVVLNCRFKFGNVSLLDLHVRDKHVDPKLIFTGTENNKFLALYNSVRNLRVKSERYQWTKHSTWNVYFINLSLNLQNLVEQLSFDKGMDTLIKLFATKRDISIYRGGAFKLRQESESAYSFGKRVQVYTELLELSEIDKNQIFLRGLKDRWKSTNDLVFSEMKNSYKTKTLQEIMDLTISSRNVNNNRHTIICSKCHKKGHTYDKCRTKKHFPITSGNNESIYAIFTINNKKVKFLLDSGSEVHTLNLRTAQRVNSTLKKENILLKGAFQQKRVKQYTELPLILGKTKFHVSPSLKNIINPLKFKSFIFKDLNFSINGLKWKKNDKVFIKETESYDKINLDLFNHQQSIQLKSMIDDLEELEVPDYENNRKFEMPIICNKKSIITKRRKVPQSLQGVLRNQIEIWKLKGQWNCGKKEPSG